MYWYFLVMREHYADFGGRARRKEYWMFMLVNMCIISLLCIAGALSGCPWICMVYGLYVLLPCVAVSVRRLHDRGKSGWLLLVSLIPVAGVAYLLYLFSLDGQKKLNAWGANPKF
ncbi:DUF805 domain-containing protein [Bacteroides caecimuris]|nr:DUF805 domain-containing protein [Bacteroides caecimuris]